MAGTMLKGIVDKARSDKPIRNARDGFATEHLEIAVYEIIERIARRAGDDETAQMAQTIRKDEEEMARTIAQDWDHFVELAFEEEHVKV